MSRFLNTRGNPTLGIGLCQRCRRKFPLHELMDDPNIRGMKVCKDDRDLYDPYRLPTRKADRISLPFVRPDQPLTDGLTTPTWEIYTTPPNYDNFIPANPTFRVTQSGATRATMDGSSRITS